MVRPSEVPEVAAERWEGELSCNELTKGHPLALGERQKGKQERNLVGAYSDSENKRK